MIEARLKKNAVEMVVARLKKAVQVTKYYVTT
jgi:hypothetical protein